MKNLVVVAESKLRKEALALVHALSKIEDVKASHWTPQHMRDNEAQVTGRSSMIFLGKNSDTEPYIELVKSVQRKHGVVFGFDGPKATIYVDSKPTDPERFQKDLKASVKAAKDAQKEVSSGKIPVGVPVGVVAGIGLVSAFALPLWFLALPVIVIIKLFRQSKNNAGIRKAQYQYGLLSFSDKCLEDYLNQLVM